MLQSFWEPRPTTNPYIVMLYRSLQEVTGVSVLTFSWRRSLLGRYDVFHVHWPETLLGGRSPVRRTVRQLLAMTLLMRLRLTRTPVVRTVHNVNPPDLADPRDRAVLRAFERAVTMRIRLNTSTDLSGLGPAEAVTLVHGHYIDWYRDRPHYEPVPGQISYFGLIRRYKGVEGLITAFRDTELPEATLRIGGSPSTPELAETITKLAEGDPRIRLQLAFLDDDELVELATTSELVVLPYRFMHNSAGVLTALSLDRPVLVPDNDVNRKLADEVGPGWIYFFASTEPAASDLVETLAKLHAEPVSGRPDLSARAWDRVGTDHVEAYQRARALASTRSRLLPSPR